MGDPHEGKDNKPSGGLRKAPGSPRHTKKPP
jgi:hypothetical protein